jgi:glycosyltransferase involved in cell wall biosynthesis
MSGLPDGIKLRCAVYYAISNAVPESSDAADGASNLSNELDVPSMTASASASPGILPLRVAFVTHALSPHRLALMECVAASLKDFRVFLSEEEDKLHKFPPQRGTLKVTLQRSLNWQHHFRNVHGYSDISHVHVPFDTYGQLSRYQPDVVITTELGIRSVLAAIYRRRHWNVRLVLWATLSERTEATRGWMRRRMRRWLLSNVDAVFFNGKGGSAYIRDLGFKGPMYFVPYAINDRPFRTEVYDPQPNVFRLLYTGQLIPRKGLPAFCSTLDQWCQDHPETTVSFKLVGEGPEREAIMATPTTVNFTVETFNRVNQEALVRYYEGSDVFAFPTLGDEWGVVVNEALIAGRPILGSIYSQAVSELTTDGSNGWLWDPDKAGSLYDALSRVFSSTPEQLKQMSINAMASVVRVSPTVIGSTILDGLYEVTGGSPGSR